MGSEVKIKNKDVIKCLQEMANLAEVQVEAAQVLSDFLNAFLRAVIDASKED